MHDVDKEITGRNQENSLELENIRQWLEEVKFRKQFLGGLSEVDVWEKIEELDSMYQEALRAERIRYDALIEEYKKDRIETKTRDSL